MELNPKPMTAKQAWFATKLLKERELDLDTAGSLEFEAHMDFLGGKFVSTREASKMIDWLLTQPEKTKPATNFAGQVLEPGVYVLPLKNTDDVIVKLQLNKAKTNAYTMKWVECTAAHLNENDEHVKGQWEYAPELKPALKPEHRMTMEQAKAFILRYGQCAKCARRLKAAKSVEEGIGPVCRKYFTAAA